MNSQREDRKLRKMNRLFISLMSHEIRTPLTSIYGYIQLLNKDKKGLSDNQKRWIQSLHFETSRMSTMIEEMLHLYQIEDNSFKIFKQEMSLLEVANNAIRRFNSLYPLYQIKLTKKVNANKYIIQGDSLKLTQVLTNLLSNAAKFSPDNKKIILNILDNKKIITLQIIDTGEGMDKEELQSLMQIVEKGKEVIKGRQGISLYLAKKIIQAHRGELTIKSQKRLGTTIEITLPVTP